LLLSPGFLYQLAAVPVRRAEATDFSLEPKANQRGQLQFNFHLSPHLKPEVRLIFPHPHLNNLPGRPATPRQHLAHGRRGTHGFAEAVVAERLPLGDGEADIGQGRLVELAAKECAVGRLARFLTSPQSEVQRMGRDDRVGLAEGVAAVAGPVVLPGVGNHVGAHGVEFDVALAGETTTYNLINAYIVCIIIP